MEKKSIDIEQAELALCEIEELSVNIKQLCGEAIQEIGANDSVAAKLSTIGSYQ